MEQIEKNNPWILFGAGDEGAKLLHAARDMSDQIFCFADNNPFKVGTLFHGKPVISFTECCGYKNEYQIVIAVSKQYEKEIAEQFRQKEITNFLFLREAYRKIRYKSSPLLQQYKNKFYGKRCFIIGTGPSLTVKDLETLEGMGEITIASNKIFRIFHETSWRPDIYCTIDSLVLEQYGHYLITLPVKMILLAETTLKKELTSDEINKNNVNWFHLLYEPYEGTELPDFSSSPDCYVIEGFTVTYAILQWAAYMGFKEMYLLGIDFDYGNKEDGYKHFLKEYDGKTEMVKPPRLDKCLKAYEKAEIYSREHGFRIYNATRGGKLEVFERVDLDELIHNMR